MAFQLVRRMPLRAAVTGRPAVPRRWMTSPAAAASASVSAPKQFDGWSNDNDFSDIDLSQLSGAAKKNPMIVRRHGMSCRDGEYRPKPFVLKEDLPEDAHMWYFDPHGSEYMFDYVEEPFSSKVVKSMIAGAFLLTGAGIYTAAIHYLFQEPDPLAVPSVAQPYSFQLVRPHVHALTNNAL